MRKPVILIALAFMLAGCETKVQTTSGKEYLARYKDAPVSSFGSAYVTTEKGTQYRVNKSIDETIREVAAVEPVLKFPARIGLARIDQGSLAPVPAEEMDAWKKAADKLGKGFGEFVPVSPMVMKMVAENVNSGRGNYSAKIDDLISEIRLGAARQHLDAVLIYEEHSTTDHSENILAMAKVSIIGGYILPSESHESKGGAEGLLIDVIQGYPYGTIHTEVGKQTELASAWGWGGKADEELSERVKIQAGKQLADEAYGMFMKLRAELAEKRAK